ncbi:MAG: type II toxin-antitoxin system VapC family toxin [Planctomycetes bacterium]|nr:type II toxin-antitoxin system VapC family toxin [Planctomycetota bacterium]
MRTVFADSFFFFALLSETDAAHEKAIAICDDSTLAIVTTAWVLTEVADGMARSANRPDFIVFIRQLHENRSIRVLPANMETFHRGLDLYCSRPDKEWSLTDCISFVAMGDEGLKEALTGDHHFEQAGFVALLR